MQRSLFDRVVHAKEEIEKRFSIKLSFKSRFLDSYPDAFEVWTLLNVIKAIAGGEEGELYGANSQTEKNIVNIVAGDVHPSGKTGGANIELVGIGMAPTLVFSSPRLNASLWYDKYVGLSDNCGYWPRPDITVRSGACDVVKSVRFETSADTRRFEGGYETRRGRVDSETVKGWRSLAELVRSNPQLKEYYNQLAHNFRITKEMFSIVSANTEETLAVAGRPLEALHTDDSEYVHGEIESDDDVIPWARKKSFTQPNAIIECKSGLLTPHAVDQLIIYKSLFSESLLIVSTTRPPGQAILMKLREHDIHVITPPASLGEKYADVLKEKLAAVINSS